MYRSHFFDLRKNLSVFVFVAVSGLVFPALGVANSASLRSLRILSADGQALVIGMFEVSTPPMGRVRCARNALASTGSVLTPGTVVFLALGAADYAPASSLLAYCTDPTDKTCRRDCQSCQLGQDVSLDEMSCGGPPSYICWQAGECLLTPNNRCCLECTYSCYGSCLDCPAPLRCRYVR